LAARTTTSDAAPALVPNPALRERLLVGAVSAAPIGTFTIAISATSSLVVAAGAALAAALVVSCWRIATRRPWRTTAGVVAVVLLQVTLAAVTGNAANFFLPRILWTVVWSPVHLVLILAGRPPLGWAVGQLSGDPQGWRQCAVQRRAYTLASLLPWSLATVEMVVALWLYTHGQVALLGGTEMLTNGMHLLAFLAAWRIAVRLMGTHRCEDHPRTCSPDERTSLMRLDIDPGRCIGSGVCALTAPEVFDQNDSDGTALLRHSEPPSAEWDSARLAARSCPAAAISISE
jgi:ferredoxin